MKGARQFQMRVRILKGSTSEVAIKQIGRENDRNKLACEILLPVVVVGEYALLACRRDG